MLDPLQTLPGQRVHSKDLMSQRRRALRKQKPNVVTARQRKEIEAVGLSPEKTPQPNVETLLVASYGSSNDGMDHKGRAHALAQVFDSFETQHGPTPVLKRSTASPRSFNVVERRGFTRTARPKRRDVMSGGTGRAFERYAEGVIGFRANAYGVG